MKTRLLCLLVAACACASACSEAPTPPTYTSAQQGTEDTPTSTEDVSTSIDDTTEPPTRPRIGGCQYKDTPGFITITSITDPAPNTSVCPKPSQEVRFSFTPTGADSPTITDRPIIIGDGKALPTACLSPLGLSIGAVIPDVVLKEITAGTCSPIVFEFPEGFLQPCTDACY